MLGVSTWETISFSTGLLVDLESSSRDKGASNNGFFLVLIFTSSIRFDSRSSLSAQRDEHTLLEVLRNVGFEGLAFESTKKGCNFLLPLNLW